MRRFVYYNAASAGASFVVDDYSLQMAFGLYKMSSSATNAIRVRRSSDNTEQDIGFSGIDLDTATLSSFVGSGSGFVVTWYNQGLGGAAFDLTNALVASQPIIILTGTLYTLNGKPAMSMSNRLLNANLSTFSNKSYGASITVLRNTETSVRRDVFSFRTPASTVRFFSTFNIPTVNRSSIYTRRLDSDSASILTQPTNYTSGDMVRTDIIDWANNDAFIRLNNNEVASSLAHGTAGSTSATNSISGGIGAIEPSMSVERLSVWVLANTDISADISNIENDINSYYGIY